MQLRNSTRIKAKVLFEDIEDDKERRPEKKRRVTISKEETVESSGNVSSSELQIGDIMPDITLMNQDNQKISLQEVAKNNKILVLFAYPKASTPGCTRQACGFRDNYDEIKKHAAVFGLSADSVVSQKRFQEKQNLPFELLSDPKRELIGILGAKKTPQSGIIRSHWVFLDGKLRFRNIKVSPERSISESKKEVMELAEKNSR
ncbi:hypothetical protein KAFR_0K01200 [Kazachstania africana CBS 2517]|uniref:thioredoxin-dependent peroxiredoxin n=1 Tax=Kazachstania africana (strain ATCC 22294 / BCRC 22015 / CBS 2517 / CECT 1963 / NBRC 1671 / NRRL Y-8276) TaxID=1071382 RepID=H2B1H5_KAZAF|nr:hypothetical protein KAFR_0K01200 [Kazachstania africana CBS 2517]CCF60475.1 hypothetical protein KAFR_0K01200 [Kazachstania africana CBS 2517]